MKLLPYTLNLAVYQTDNGLIRIRVGHDHWVSETDYQRRPAVTPPGVSGAILSQHGEYFERLLHDLCADLLKEARKKGGVM